jgi:hypothetical protein
MALPQTLQACAMVLNDQWRPFLSGYTGKGLANPTALLLSSLMMLRYVNVMIQTQVS